MTVDSEALSDFLVQVLGKDDRVIFAYLCGSMLTKGEGNDIDIAVFPKSKDNPHLLAADVKIALHRNKKPVILSVKM